MIREYTSGDERVFILRNLIEVRIPEKRYRKMAEKYSREYIISFGEPRKVLNHITGRELVYVTKEGGIPLLGYNAFGVIDRGNTLLQVRPLTGCNLNCIFCSVDEGRKSRTRVTDFIVEPEYLAQKLREIAEYKGHGLEAHIDGQGEPLLYPYMEELLGEIRKIAEIDTISIQTNGSILDDELIDILEKYVDRINLSIITMNTGSIHRIYNSGYPLERVKETAERIARNSEMDLLLAPVWLPGINDGDIKKIIEFALEIGAGKRGPPLGIQKYIPHRFGRKLKQWMSFEEFYTQLMMWEREYGIKLILTPEDFGIERRRRFPDPLKKGETYTAKVISRGRMDFERLVAVKDRIVSVKTGKPPGKYVRFRITRVKDGLYEGKEITKG